MKIFANALAKRVAKRRFDGDQGRLAAEADWNQEESERILREVKEVGGWEAWDTLKKQHEQSILDEPPPDEGPLSPEEMWENYEPEPPEDPEQEKLFFNRQDAEQILREVKEAGGWEAWEALEQKRG